MARHANKRRTPNRGMALGAWVGSLVGRGRTPAWRRLRCGAGEPGAGSDGLVGVGLGAVGLARPGARYLARSTSPPEALRPRLTSNRNVTTIRQLQGESEHTCGSRRSGAMKRPECPARLTSCPAREMRRAWRQERREPAQEKVDDPEAVAARHEMQLAVQATASPLGGERAHQQPQRQERDENEEHGLQLGEAVASVVEPALDRP